MPSSENLLHLLLLSENSVLKRHVVRKCKRGKKRWGVHPIKRRRRIYGEYHHLIKQLKEGPERFFQYIWMSIPTMGFILNRLKGRLEKKRIGLLQQVKPEERLVLTLRYGLDNLKFGKMVVGRYPDDATKYHINDSSDSKHLLTVIMFREGKEFLRRLRVDRNEKLFKFFFTERAAFDLNNSYNECKSNPLKMKKKTVEEHKKEE